MAGKSALGLHTLTGLVIANMIGAGVFTTSGFALTDLQSPWLVMLAWLIGAVVALTGAMSYGALARVLPLSGGEYLYLSRLVHPAAGFVAGWISLLAGFTGAIAFVAITFTAYVQPVSFGLHANITASLIILVAALFHGIRRRHGTLIQNIAVLLKLLLIGVFVLVALAGLPGGHWQGLQQPGAGTGAGNGVTVADFALTLMWISFSYSGFNAAVYIAGEVDQAAALVPRAMLRATLITAVIYLVLNTIFVFAPAADTVIGRADVAAVAAQALGGQTLETLVRVIIAVALFSSISAMIMIGPRVYAQMAHDRLFPGFLRFTGDVPSSAVFMQALLAIVVVWLAGIRELLGYLGFTLGLSAALTVSCLFIVNRRDPQLTRDLPWFPWAPVVFVCFTLVFAALAARENPWELLAALGTIFSGLAIFFLLRHSR